jgi:molybdopterin converting factor small subunit
MQITVTYRGQAKLAAGVASEVLELDAPCTVGELVAGLAERRGGALRQFLLDRDGAPRRHILFIVGSDQVRPESRRALDDGDEVTILPPMAGG